MADQKISVVFLNTGKKKRLSRGESVIEFLKKIQSQFSIEGEFTVKAKIDDGEYDIETDEDAGDYLDAEELIVYAKEALVKTADKLVKIEDEEFRIDAIPLTTATIVQRHRNLLIHDLDLHSMVKELQDLKNFLRLAYYGTACCTDVQIEVQGVGFIVTELCERSKLTLGMFASTCGDILEKLRCSYLYLTEGLDQMTLSNLKNVADISKRMTLASAELKSRFNAGVEKAQLALVATQREQAKQQNSKQETLTEIKETDDERVMKEEELPRYEMLLDVSIEEVNYKSNVLRDEKNRESKILESDCLAKIFTELTEGKERPSVNAQREVAKAIESKRIVMQKKIETNENIRRFINKVKTLKERDEIIDSSISALHKAVSGMKGLSDIMLKAELFWTSLSDVVDKVVNESDMLKDKVTSGAEFEKVERSKLWQSETFKIEAVKYLSVWVAVMDICSSHRGDMDHVTKGLHEFLRENPTREEAAMEMNKICADFELHLKNSDEELLRRQQNLEDELIEHENRPNQHDTTRQKSSSEPSSPHMAFESSQGNRPSSEECSQQKSEPSEEACLGWEVRQWYMDILMIAGQGSVKASGRPRWRSAEHLVGEAYQDHDLKQHPRMPRHQVLAEDKGFHRPQRSLSRSTSAREPLLSETKEQDVSEPFCSLHLSQTQTGQLKTSTSPRKPAISGTQDLRQTIRHVPLYRKHPHLPGQHQHHLGQHQHLPGQHQHLPGQHQHLPGQHQLLPGQNKQRSGQHQQHLGQHQLLPGQNKQRPGQLKKVSGGTHGHRNLSERIERKDETGAKGPQKHEANSTTICNEHYERERNATANTMSSSTRRSTHRMLYDEIESIEDEENSITICNELHERERNVTAKTVSSSTRRSTRRMVYGEMKKPTSGLEDETKQRRGFQDQFHSSNEKLTGMKSKEELGQNDLNKCCNAVSALQCLTSVEKMAIGSKCEEMPSVKSQQSMPPDTFGDADLTLRVPNLAGHTNEQQRSPPTCTSEAKEHLDNEESTPESKIPKMSCVPTSMRKNVALMGLLARSPEVFKTRHSE